MSDKKTRVENCLVALVALVKSQSNDTLPGRLTDRAFAPVAPKARKTMKAGRDDHWTGDVWTNINALNWEMRLGDATRDEEFADKCEQIANCFGVGIVVVEDFVKAQKIIRIGIWTA